MSFEIINGSMASYATDSHEKMGALQHLMDTMNFFKRESLSGEKEFIFLLGDIDLPYMIREQQDCNANILKVWHSYLYGKSALDIPYSNGNTQEMLIVVVFEVLNNIKNLRWSDVKDKPVVEFRLINNLTLDHILKNSLKNNISNYSKVSDIKMKNSDDVCLVEVGLAPLTKDEFCIIQNCKGLEDILDEVCKFKYNERFENIDNSRDKEKVWKYSRKIAQHILSLAELVRETMIINNKKSFNSLSTLKNIGSKVGIMCSSTDSIRFK